MSEIKLTIAISTYNRCNLLKECIENILPQINDEVELIISDNASQDNTSQMMEGYLKYPFIKYYRNESNNGMDANFLNCMVKATGKYVHLMSDDDIILPGTVKSIIHCIDIHNPDLIHLNSCEFSGDFNVNSKLKKPRFDFDENLVTYDKSSFLKSIGIYLTFLSSMVLKTELVNKINNPQQYLGTYFLHSHIAFKISEGNKKFVILKHNSIAERSGNAGGYNLFRIWIQEYKKLLFKTGISAGYNKKDIKKLYIKSLKNEIRGFIITFRIKNTGFQLNQRYLLLKHTFTYPSVWISLYPFAFFPTSLLKFLVRSKSNNHV